MCVPLHISRIVTVSTRGCWDGLLSARVDAGSAASSPGSQTARLSVTGSRAAPSEWAPGSLSWFGEQRPGGAWALRSVTRLES